MAKLFGFSIEDNDKLPASALSPVAPNKEDGVDHYLTSGFFGSYIDIEGVYRTEFDLIKRYREMALHPEVDSAIEDIVNEAIVSDTNDSPIQIELSNLNASDGIKQKIREEFKYILELLDFDKKCHEIYRNWYVDGRIFYHKVIDLKKPHEGIQELRYIDAMKIRHVRQEKRVKKPQMDPMGMKDFGVAEKNPMNFKFPEIEEFFIYDPKSSYPVGAAGVGNLASGSADKGIKIAADAITYCTSGLIDRNKGTVLSYLNKAIKSLNQLRMIEDSLVIYRLCLVGETRVKTNVGYSYIKDINVGDKVYAYDNTIDSLVETSVTNKWMTGVKDTYTVKSKHHKVTGTDTHPILVYDSVTNEVKYVPIKDLIPKRHHVTYIKSNDDGIEISNIKIENNRIPKELFLTTNKIKKNFILDQLSNFISYEDTLDGFFCKIAHEDRFLIEDIKEIWTSIGLCSGHIKRVNNCWLLYLSEYELPMFEKIMSVDFESTEEVYDIEVEHEKHNFVANGIIVHNSRAPERRIFYIDVGNLPKVKAEQYLRDVMMHYRNKLVYDASTGETRDDRRHLSMLEDFWLPRREGGRGTEIDTLPGGQNLGEITDINYFQKKLYESLNVPSSRIGGEGGFNLGKSSEILRDEVKFSKFVGRLRKRFSNLFNDMLKTQLILKNIITPEDWKKMNEHIQYDFLYDNHFAELKDAELLADRLNSLSMAEPYIGKYFSQDYIRRKVLRQTDQEIYEQDMLIQKEIEKGIIPDPNAQIDPNTGQPLPPGAEAMPPDQGNNINGAMGKVPVTPEQDASSVEIPKGGVI
jgi:hypothetical protein